MKLIAVLISFLPSLVFAQDYFKVEFEAFSPSDQEVIQTLKGYPAEQFLANDIAGEEVSLYTSPDKVKLLWFWNSTDDASMALLPYLNILQLDELDHAWIYGFADGDKETAKKVSQDQGLIFSIIPNAGPLGEFAYGGDLGANRLFFLDKDLIIREVLPRSFFLSKQPEEAIEAIRQIIQSIK